MRSVERIVIDLDVQEWQRYQTRNMESFAPASKWMAVLASLAVAVFLPMITMAITAFFLPRKPARTSDGHWAECARRLYPFKAVRLISLSVLPVMYTTATNFYPDSILPIPRWMLCSLIFLASFGATNWTIWVLGRRYQLRPESFWERLRKTAAYTFLYTLIILCGITAALLPSDLNWRLVVVLSAGLIAYFWLQFGGLLQIGRWLGFLRPADPEVSEMAKELARHWQRPAPTVWLFNLGSANALALPFARAVLITDKARPLFSADELLAILAHELAHLYEDKVTRLMRLLAPLLYIPLLKVLLMMVTDPEKSLPLLVLVPAIMIGFIFVSRRRRRMEVRADLFGSRLHDDKSIYAQALAKLYQANEIPAVMPRKRSVHPHLYDRMLVAGITPDFPRPNPPPRWGSLVVLSVAAVNMVGFLGALYFVLDFFDRV